MDLRILEKEFIDGLAHILTSGRRTGNTTRLVDYSIQFLFKHGYLSIDWLVIEGNKLDQKHHAFNLIKGRLKAEHSIFLHMNKKNTCMDMETINFKFKDERPDILYKEQ